jgi:Xaa-Pro aminopeptidase
MRDRFTRVLKGHIAIATARFPKGTSGAQLDVLARKALWDTGLDFDHGTGHGVGSYLSVHEGPQRISKLGHVPLEPGMIVSNEPGYYREDEYGIRIENLLAVRALERRDGEEREMMSFETLTWAPIDLHLVNAALLTEDETEWLDDYHERVFEVVGPRLREKERDWLETATKPLSTRRRRKKGRITFG